MGNDGNPQAASPHQQVTQPQAEHHAWKESVELQMEGTEDDGDNPDGDMPVHAAVLHHAQHRTAKQDFLAQSSHDAHNRDTSQQAAHSVDVQYLPGRLGSTVFHGSHPVFKPAERSRQRHRLVGCHQPVECRHRHDIESQHDEQGFARGRAVERHGMPWTAVKNSHGHYSRQYECQHILQYE